MQEILDVHHLNQHIHTLDWLISNTANAIQDITNKDYLLDHSIIEWKFQISRKASEKIQKSRRGLTKIIEENFSIDLKKNLQIDIKKHSNRIRTTSLKQLKRQWTNMHH